MKITHFAFYLCCAIFPLQEAMAQKYSLRSDVGLSASRDAFISSEYFKLRHYSLALGVQLHRQSSEKHAFSIGLYRQSFERKYTSTIGCNFETGETYYTYHSQLYDHLLIPLTWHMRFGKSKRFELSTGMYYAIELGTRSNDAGLSDWTPIRKNNVKSLGLTLGFQYSIIKSDQLDVALSYRSTNQLTNFNSSFYHIQYAPSNKIFFASLFTVNCTVPL